MNIHLPNDLERAAQTVAIAQGFESVTAYLVDFDPDVLRLFEA